MYPAKLLQAGTETQPVQPYQSNRGFPVESMIEAFAGDRTQALEQR